MPAHREKDPFLRQNHQFIDKKNIQYKLYYKSKNREKERFNAMEAL